MTVSAPAAPPHPLCNENAACCMCFETNPQVPGHLHPAPRLATLTGVSWSMQFSTLSLSSLLIYLPMVAFS